MTRAGLAWALLLAGCALSHGREAPGDAGPEPPRSRPRWRAIEAGDYFSCALALDGVAWCWGSNGSGQLGVGGGEAEIFAPRRVDTDARFRQLSAGASHLCGVDDMAQLYCWGSNINLALGTGDEANRDRPTRVVAVATEIIEVRAGAFHTCASDVFGDVYCWGSNSRGQCGVPDVRAVPRPSAPVLDGALALASGDSHSCALRVDGVWCWGSGERGQRGDGGETSPEPRRVPGVEGARGLFAGGTTTCATGPFGVRCWGGNEHGQAGDGGGPDRETPVDASSLPREVVEIEQGANNHACLLGEDRRVRCWGFAGSGRLGDGTEEERRDPVEPLGLPNAGDVAVGAGHGCALSLDDRVHCWGLNLSGQLGEGPEGKRPFPAEVAFP